MKSNCKNCGKEFSYSPSQSKGLYCSNKCQRYLARKECVEAGTPKSVKKVRQYLIERDIYECVMCGNKGEWMGHPLPLQLDHINGDPKDHRLENVRWLCPNCHCQTDTWGVKNMKKGL